MLEPEEIEEHVGRALGEQEAFLGRSVLVTAGPTREPLDPVRYLGNRSSGRMGYALARAAWRRGARVSLVTGPTSLDPPPGCDVIRVETAGEMKRAVEALLPGMDVSIFAAAVADFRPTTSASEKIKRNEAGPELTLRLTANPDIAADTRTLRSSGSVVVGFALETRNLLEGARAKLDAKGFDLLVANAAGAEGSGFDVETNEVTFLYPGGRTESLPLLPKDEVAEEVLDRVAELLARAP